MLPYRATRRAGVCVGLIVSLEDTHYIWSDTDTDRQTDRQTDSLVIVVSCRRQSQVALRHFGSSLRGGKLLLLFGSRLMYALKGVHLRTPELFALPLSVAYHTYGFYTVGGLPHLRLLHCRWHTTVSVLTLSVDYHTHGSEPCRWLTTPTLERCRWLTTRLYATATD